MASDLGFVQFVVDQLAVGCAVTYRKMFGEYGLYSQGTFFGVVCDNRFFVKPTEGGRALIGQPVEAPPHPGAKPSFLIEDRLEDSEWLAAPNTLRAAALWALAGDTARALDGLEQAYAERNPGLIYPRSNIGFAGISSHSRVQAVVRRMGLPAP